MSCLSLTFHPNGQPYKEHWEACGVTVTQQNGELVRRMQVITSQNATIAARDARILRLVKKCGSKCKGL